MVKPKLGLSLHAEYSIVWTAFSIDLAGNSSSELGGESVRRRLTGTGDDCLNFGVGAFREWPFGKHMVAPLGASATIFLAPQGYGTLGFGNPNDSSQVEYAVLVRTVKNTRDPYIGVQPRASIHYRTKRGNDLSLALLGQYTFRPVLVGTYAVLPGSVDESGGTIKQRYAYIGLSFGYALSWGKGKITYLGPAP